MNKSKQSIAPILLAPLRERFFKDGNIYDMDCKSKFTHEDKEALRQKHPELTNSQLNDFVKNAYADHPGEQAFRKYLGEFLPRENVSNHC